MRIKVWAARDNGPHSYMRITTLHYKEPDTVIDTTGKKEWKSDGSLGWIPTHYINLKPGEKRELYIVTPDELKEATDATDTHE